MANEMITKPYNILLQYCCEKGEKAGYLRGLSLEQRAFLVDENGLIVAKIDRGEEDHPAEFPPDELKKFLGQDFVTFNAQLSEARKLLAAAEASHEKTKAEAGASIQQLNDAHAAEVEGLRARLQAFGDAVAQAHGAAFSAR